MPHVSIAPHVVATESAPALSAPRAAPFIFAPRITQREATR
ncbi:hypothetical protein BURPSPAST_C1351 [Burkholderia pseudomallei Pasteur 52237]|nr:hypothetical protein BURPSPAST_C1351 [Burkholderia pseudomallei Pasteur 52237]